MKKNLIALGTLLIATTLSSCSFSATYSDTFLSLDTYISISITTTGDGNTHLKNIKNIYKDIDIVADNFEAHNGKSVYDLNQNRELELSDSLKSLIEVSIDAKNKTNGYYNPLIGRLSEKWKDAIENNEILSDDVIQSELEIMNNSSIKIEDNKAIITGDANLDLGGIAKGYATELVHDYLVENNITEYLINSGESNIIVGNRSNKYTVGLSKALSDGLYTKLKLTDKAIGTSSPKYQNNEIDGVLYHHILSPFTGYPVNNYESVNVICDNSIFTDCYSTAIFVMDLEYAKQFIYENNISAILCSNNEIIYKKLGDDIEEV